MALLAHQGGWDEALFVVGPLLFIVALLRMAKNRAEKARPASSSPSETAVAAPTADESAPGPQPG